MQKPGLHRITYTAAPPRIDLENEINIIQSIHRSLHYTLDISLNPFKLITEIVVSPKIARPCMTLEVLSACCSSAQPSQFAACLTAGDFLICHGAKIFSNPQTSRKSRSFLGGKDVVGANDLTWLAWNISYSNQGHTLSP